MKQVIYLIVITAPFMAAAQKTVLSNETIHLRDGLGQEWSTFPVTAKDSVFKIHFDAQEYKKDAVISLIQTDVNHPWSRRRNDERTVDHHCRRRVGLRSDHGT